MEIIARAQVSQLMFNYKHYEERENEKWDSSSNQWERK